MSGPAATDGDPVEWDAVGYQKLSTPQQACGGDVLRRLDLAGDETVLDLGCGAGVITEKLVELVPRGHVIGVDASRAMLEAARTRLGSSAQFVLADLRTFRHAPPVDVVFSTATLHWVPDHASLWRRVHAMLRPGGTLEAQYGGVGNIAAVVEALPRLTTRAPFDRHLAPCASPWTFDDPHTAERELHAAGFSRVRTWLEPRPARPPDMRAYLANSVVPHELARLPASLRPDFVAALFNDLGRPDLLDHVRLNVSAVA